GGCRAIQITIRSFDESRLGIGSIIKPIKTQQVGEGSVRRNSEDRAHVSGPALMRRAIEIPVAARKQAGVGKEAIVVIERVQSGQRSTGAYFEHCAVKLIGQ